MPVVDWLGEECGFQERWRKTTFSDQAGRGRDAADAYGADVMWQRLRSACKTAASYYE
jgi:hypothetical protein